MSIQVTRETFSLIFNKESRVLDVVNLEHANMYYYYNKETDQQGLIVENFLSNVKEFYLKDINA